MRWFGVVRFGSVWFGRVRRPKRGKKEKYVRGDFFGSVWFGGVWRGSVSLKTKAGGPSSQEEKLPPTLRSMVTKNRFCGLTQGLRKVQLPSPRILWRLLELG